MLKIEMMQGTEDKTFYVPVYYESVDAINQTQYFANNVQVVPITAFFFLNKSLQDHIRGLMIQVLNAQKDNIFNSQWSFQNFNEGSSFLITNFKTDVTRSDFIWKGYLCYLKNKETE